MIFILKEHYENEIKEQDLQKTFNRFLKENKLDWEVFKEQLQKNRKLNIKDFRIQKIDLEIENLANHIIKEYPNLACDNLNPYLTLDIDFMGLKNIKKINILSDQEKLMEYLLVNDKDKIKDNLMNIELLKESSHRILERFDENIYILKELNLKLQEKFMSSIYKDDDKYKTIQSNLINSLNKKDSFLNDGADASIHLLSILTALYKHNRQSLSDINEQESLVSRNKKLKR